MGGVLAREIRDGLKAEYGHAPPPPLSIPALHQYSSDPDGHKRDGRQDSAHRYDYQYSPQISGHSGSAHESYAPSYSDASHQPSSHLGSESQGPYSIAYQLLDSDVVGPLAKVHPAGHLLPYAKQAAQMAAAASQRRKLESGHDSDVGSEHSGSSGPPSASSYRSNSFSSSRGSSLNSSMYG